MFIRTNVLRGTMVCLSMLCLCGCGKDREVEEPTPVSAQDVAPGAAQSQPEPTTDDSERRVELAARVVAFGAGGAPLSSDGGTIVAGDSRLEVPSGAMREDGILQIESFAVDEITRDLPRGLLLAAGSSEPANLGLTRVAKFYVPLQFEIPESAGDVELELLSWHPSLGTWLTTAYADVSPGDALALFYTDYIGTFVVRVRAEWDDERLTRCSGDTLNLGEAIPENEERAVGITAAGKSMNRGDAFATLADARLMQLPGYISFKNEEYQDRPGRIAADERDHQDEDFLMDPQLAESLRILGDLVASEWMTPFTGEPAYDLRVTEAFDSLGEHRSVSTHYQGRALDLTLTPVPRGNLVTRRAFYGRLARLAVCAGFGYSLFENRFHVHVSSKSTKMAMLVENTLSDGWSVWIYDFAHPATPTLLYSGGGQLPENVSWADDEGVQLWSGQEELIGQVSLSGQLRAADGAAAEPGAIDDAEMRAIEPLGNRKVRVVDGRAFLVHRGDAFSPGTIDAEGRELAFEEPLDITPRTEGAFVRATAVLVTAPLRAAREQFSQ